MLNISILCPLNLFATEMLQLQDKNIIFLGGCYDEK